MINWFEWSKFESEVNAQVDWTVTQDATASSQALPTYLRFAPTARLQPMSQNPAASIPIAVIGDGQTASASAPPAPTYALRTFIRAVASFTGCGACVPGLASWLDD